MIDEQIISFVKWNREQGCEAELTYGALDDRVEPLPMPGVLTRRYGTLPEPLHTWIQQVNKLVAPQEQAWFLTEADYSEPYDDAVSDPDAAGFHWNEWERISLDAALDDAEWQQQIRAFWDRYVPLVMIVQPEYAFYAVDTHSSVGAVIYGREPEFEEYEEVAASFEEFLQRIMNGTLKWYNLH